MRSFTTGASRIPQLLAIALLVAGALTGSAHASTPSEPLSITIKKNHFVDATGRTVQLRGVNHTSAEYACVDGYGYDDGHFTGKDAAAIRSWGANAVRIPLNEDCWLGANGQPNSSQGADPPLTAAGYRHEIESYVTALHAHGLYVILDLHWTAPGAQVALEQQPMPDADHSPAFWTSVATAFKNDPAVVFDLFNEPWDPTDRRSGDDQDGDDKVTWNCWETGTQDGTASGTPCDTAAYDEDNNKTATYQVAGMQSLVDAVRATGATQPVLIGGLNYANDLSSWRAHEPTDPLHRIAASFHNYTGKGKCDTVSCWKSSIAPVAAHVPVVTGEFAEDDYLESHCSVKKPSTFDATFMKWADSTGVSYLAWGWIVLTKAERHSEGCSAYYLIGNYNSYPAAKPNGTAVRTHLRARAS